MSLDVWGGQMSVAGRPTCARTLPASPAETEVSLCRCHVHQGRARARDLVGAPCRQPVLFARGERTPRLGHIPVGGGGRAAPERMVPDQASEGQGPAGPSSAICSWSGVPCRGGAPWKGWRPLRVRGGGQALRSKVAYLFLASAPSVNRGWVAGGTEGLGSHGKLCGALEGARWPRA